MFRVLYQTFQYEVICKLYTYGNDMYTVLQVLFKLLFADDTKVFIIGKDMKLLTSIMTNKLPKLVPDL